MAREKGGAALSVSVSIIDDDNHGHDRSGINIKKGRWSTIAGG